MLQLLQAFPYSKLAILIPTSPMPSNFTMFTICVTIHLKKKYRNENKQTAASDMQRSDTLRACVLGDQTTHFHWL